METEIENKKYNSIDITKWIMAIYVIAVHTHPLEAIKGSKIYNIYEIIISIAVPIFFMTSAYLLFYKMRSSYNEKENIKSITKYIIKIAKLYLIWNIIYFPLAIYGYVQNGTEIIEAIKLYIKGFLFVGEQFYSWHLWYLLSTIYSMISIKILLKCKFKEWHILIISVITFILAEVITQISKGQIQLEGSLQVISNIISKTIVNGRILTGFCYISIGMCIAKYKTQIDKRILISLIAISFIVSVYYTNIITPLLLCTCIFLLIISTELKDRSIYYYLRKSSTIMYFSHMLFFFVWTLKVGEEQKYGMQGFTITLISTIILSTIMIYIQKKKNNKILKALFN